VGVAFRLCLAFNNRAVARFSLPFAFPRGIPAPVVDQKVLGKSGGIDAALTA
jgi:hypothetical protein